MLTPKRAIQEHCRECVSGDLRHVRDCQGDTVQCPLFPVRLRNGRIPVRFIRIYCLYCMGGNRNLPSECSTYSCTLHPYRLGKSPSHQNRPGPTSKTSIKREMIRGNNDKFEL